MGKRRCIYHTSRIKKTLSYTVEEVARLFGVTARTVWRWIDEGLRTIDNRNPRLIYGAELELFLRNFQKKRKKTCLPDELYCCRCHSPRRAKANEVILVKLNDKIGRISGLCSKCECRMSKIVSVTKIEEIKKTFVLLTTRNTNLM